MFGLRGISTAKIDVTVSVDEELKQQAEELFGELSMSLSEAFSLFLRECVNKRTKDRCSAPFDFSTDEEVVELEREILRKRRKFFEDMGE